MGWRRRGREKGGDEGDESGREEYQISTIRFP